jgi:hypothetical protein
VVDGKGGMQDQNVVEFNFVDRENVSCGICGDIVPYANLFNDHMVNRHPEFADYTLEDVPYDVSFVRLSKSPIHLFLDVQPTSLRAKASQKCLSALQQRPISTN